MVYTNIGVYMYIYMVCIYIYIFSVNILFGLTEGYRMFLSLVFTILMSLISFWRFVGNT